MILRPTTQGTNDSLLNYVFANQTRYNEYSEQASTGKKLTTPSDNPIDASNVLNVNKKLSQLNGYLDNMSTAQNELDVLDNTLASITSSLQKANDLAVQAANGTNSQDSRDTIKAQIDQIIENLVSLGNTDYNGVYIFSGTNISTPPFNELSTGGVEYVGTPQDKDYQRYIQISDGVKTAINIPGDKLLGSYDAQTQTGTGVLKTLYDLSNALGSGDVDGIRNSIDQVQAGIQNNSNIRTQFASITSRFEMTTTSINNNILQLKEYKSNLENVDMTEALTNLANANIAYQASMQVAAMTLQSSSLLNYM